MFTLPTARDQSLFCKRLSMLLRAGLPISTCLHLMIEEKVKTSQQKMLQKTVVLVEAGVPLSRALLESQYNLGSFAYNVIRIGETSGTLPENLEYVAKELKSRHDLRKQIIFALIYPAIIISATIIISIFLVMVIFPKIIPIFQSLETTLPWTTRVLLEVSYVLTQYWPQLLLALGGSLMVIGYLRQKTLFRWYVAQVVLRVPILSRLIRAYQVASACRTLGMLLASEVRILESLEIVAESTTHPLYHAAWKNITSQIESGQQLSKELRRYPVLFPALLIQMVQAGESTGNLSYTLRYVGEIYEGEVHDITKNLPALLEPLLMLIMGLVVGFIAVSIITPIYGITEHLHK